MALHDSLRELVAVRGAAVLDDADELRGALDDFLAEDEATLGELNLLVDAVRLGGLRRMADVLDHGAAPDAAIREAGVALARDRGTDDPTRSCWALAALGFALGRIEEPLVRTYRSESGTVGAPGSSTTTPPPPPPPPPPPSPITSPPATFVTSSEPAPRRTLEEPPTAQAQPPPPLVSPLPAQRDSGGGSRHRASRRGPVTYLLIGVAALVAAGLVVLGVRLLGDREPEESTSGGDQGSASVGLPGDTILVTYNEGDTSRLFEMPATGTGTPTQLTDGPADRLPAVSPDRTMVTFLEGRPQFDSVLYALDLSTGERARVFADDGPCAYAARPGWSPSGDRIAVGCMDAEEADPAVYVIDGLDSVDGLDDLPLDPGNEPVLPDPLVFGSPTWVDEETFLYTRYTDESESGSQMWSLTLGQEPVAVGEEGLITHVDWSPEADRLLFLVHDDSLTDDLGTLWFADADGNATPVSGTSYGHPVWSPDGTQIAFTFYDDSGQLVLGTAPVDDPTAATALPNPPPGEVGIPVWGSR